VSGFNGAVWGLALAPNGQTLYAGGDFTTCDDTSCGRAAVLVGAQWLPLGTTGLNNTCYNVSQGPDGLVYFVGGFSAVDGVSSRANIVAWTGYETGQWVGVDIQPSGPLFSASWRGRDLWLCPVFAAATATAAATNTVVYAGPMGGRPHLDIVGPATIHHINLWPADWSLFGIPFVVAAGEEVSIHFEAPTGPSVISKTRGVIETGAFEGASDRGGFRFTRGTQIVRPYATPAAKRVPPGKFVIQDEGLKNNIDAVSIKKRSKAVTRFCRNRSKSKANRLFFLLRLRKLEVTESLPQSPECQHQSF
jgi:hypothetical protein